MSIAELRRLAASEKMKIIETLWNDLAADEASVDSPGWHEQELQKTETDFAADRVEILDWGRGEERIAKAV